MADIIPRGDVSISINTQETEAKLTFTPNAQNGTEWDMAALVNLVEEHQFVPPPSPQDLESFLQKAAAAKGPIDLVLCQGIPPEETVPEQPAWEPLEIPPDMAPYIEETLAKAGGPVIVKTKIERVKRETLVQKPNKLPFLHPKEEVAIVWDKKEVQESIPVEAKVREKRYAQKGSKVGVIYPAKPGKPGKNIYGKAIPSPGAEQPEFLLGAGLSRERNDIRALSSGILRIGSHWADIVPLAKPSWEVVTGSDGLTPCLKFTPGNSRFARPTAAEILAAVTAKGGAPLVSSQEIDAAIKESMETGAEIDAFSLFQAQESQVDITISPDELTAVLRLRKALGGGQPLELRAVSEAIKDSKVQGFDEEKLKTALHAFMDGEEQEFQYTLVEGHPSARGKDMEVQIQVPPLSPEESHRIWEQIKTYTRYKQLEAMGKLFPLSMDLSLGFVEKDGPVAHITQSVEGERGKDVFGNILPSLPGNDPQLHLYQGLYLREPTIFTGRPGLFMGKVSAGEFWGQVLDYRDSKITVHIADDAMEASVDLIRALGAGKPLALEGIHRALADAGITKGIDPHAVEAAFHTAQDKGKCETYTVARGEPPIAKGGSAVRWLLGISAHTRMAIRQGTPLAELSPPGGEGKPGFDVRGTILDSEHQGGSIVFDTDSVTETPLEQDKPGARILAAHSGELTFDGTTLRIKHSENIQGDVGAETGNINFPGEIWIIGKVYPGYSVIGAEDVFISGTAEGALISAGGKAVIAKGVRGAGKGVVRARTIIETPFVNQATLMAVEDIRIRTTAARSTIKTNGKLIFLEETGGLFGGICKARLGINAANLGSHDEEPTAISFGQDYLLENQIEVVEQEIARLEERLPQLDQEIKQVEHIPASLAASRTEKVQTLKSLKQLNLKMYSLQVKFREHHDSEIRVRGMIYPGVVMESHGRYYEIKKKRSRVIFSFDPLVGRIVEAPLT